jgi:hypothetical protein
MDPERLADLIECTELRVDTPSFHFLIMPVIDTNGIRKVNLR